MTAKAVRSVVGGAIPLGPEAGRAAADYLDLGGMGKNARRIFDEAARYVPTSMLDTVRRGKVKAVRDMSLDRSEFDPDANAVRIGRGADELVVVHELMHAVEEHDAAFLEAERAYFEERTKGKRIARLSELTGISTYDFNEIAYDVGNGCIGPYAFKIYARGYELMSIGVETLYRSPGTFLADPGMLKWVLSMLGRF